MMIHILTAAALLATPVSVSRWTAPTERIDNAFADLSTAQAPIPQQALQAYGLKILERLKHDSDAKVDNCVAFEKTTMQQVPCVELPR